MHLADSLALTKNLLIIFFLYIKASFKEGVELYVANSFKFGVKSFSPSSNLLIAFIIAFGAIS
jgi:hypothetical protein